MSQRHIELLGFGSDFELFVLRHAFQCPHIMEPVAEFQKDYSHVIAHGCQQLLEILALYRVGSIVENAVNLGKPRSKNVYFDAGYSSC